MNNNHVNFNFNNNILSEEENIFWEYQKVRVNSVTTKE